MSNIGFDQLLQITAPAPSARESSRSGTADGELFRSHLNRATDVADAKETPKSTPIGKESDTSRVEDDDALQSKSGDQPTSNTDQEQPARVTDSERSTVESAEEETAEDSEVADEVTISTAAAAVTVQEAEAQVNAEAQLELGTQQSQQGTGSSNQQQTGEQLAQQAAESATETGFADTASDATVTADLESLVNVQTTGTEASDQQQAAETQTEVTDLAQIGLQSETIAVAAAATTVEAPKKNQSSPGGAQSHAVATEQSLENSELILPENDAGGESTRSEASGNARSTVGQIQDLSSALTPELATSEVTTLGEATVHLPESVAHSANNEAIATAGKPSGTLAASQLANSQSGGVEHSTSETSTVDRVQFVRRVGGAIRSAQQRDGQIQLRLSPPELGTLKIQLTVNQGSITANLETENAAARTVLLDNLPALRERLAQQGITIEKFDVNVGQEGQQQTGNHGAEDQNSNPSRNNSRPSSPKLNDNESLAPKPTSNATMPTADEGLDIRI